MIDKKERIINAASTIIENKGSSGLTVRTVAKKCKSHPHLIYNHFKNKNGLLSHVAQRLTNEMLTESLCFHRSNKDQLIHTVSVFLKKVSKTPHIIDFIFFNPEIGQILPKNSPSIADNLSQKINAVIADLSKEKKIKTQELSLRIWSTINGLAMLIKQGVLKYSPQLAENRLSYI